MASGLRISRGDVGANLLDVRATSGHLWVRGAQCSGLEVMQEWDDGPNGDRGTIFSALKLQR